MSFQIVPLPADVASHLRRAATIVRVADANPGYPCRACLRDAEVGEELVLAAYDPFASWSAAADSPYRSAGPIFVHRRDCASDVDDSPVPTQLAGRRLSVRSYDAGAMMSDARVVDGHDLGAVLDELAARADVERVHVHNAGPGCFAAAVMLTAGRASD